MGEFIHFFYSIMHNWYIVAFSIAVIFILAQNLLRLIDVRCDLFCMCDDEKSSATHLNSTTKLCLDGLTSHMICQECSMVQHSLHSITLVPRNPA